MPAVIQDEKNKALQGKARRRFYEPLVMLKALSVISESRPSEESTASEASVGTQTPKDRFSTFVYRLAYACASDIGRDTVTSMAVMESEDSFIFVFACNGISPKEGKHISKHIKALLADVNEANASQNKSVGEFREEALKKILLFNRDRIEMYLKRIVKYASECLNTYHDNGDEVTASLKRLAACVQVDSLSNDTDDDYISCCLRCLEEIKTFGKASRSTQEHGVESEWNPTSESWSELKHCVSRMRAYEEATRSLFKAGNEWPCLFEGPQTLHVPSSKPEPNPLGKRSQSAEAIVGRMTSDRDVLENFQEYAQEMRRFNLDGRLREEMTKDSFKPLVHSEVLVQDWIVHEGYKQHLRFFNGWKYIGSSKPPCRMCKYYFEACGSDIALRTSHGNVYTHWRFPTAHGPGGSPSAREWQKSLNNMMVKIREDAFKVMSEKSSVGKNHDSNTYDLGSASSTRFSQPPTRSAKAESVAADDGSESDTAGLDDLLRDTLTLNEKDEGGHEDKGGAAL